MKMCEFREKLVEILGEPDSEDKLKDSFVRWEWGSYQVNVYGIWDDSECWFIDVYDDRDIIDFDASVDSTLSYASAWKGAKDE